MKMKKGWLTEGRAAVAARAARKIALPIALMVLLVLAALPSTAQAAPKLRLNKTKATVYVGKTVTLKASGASGTVTWASKNKKIATVKKVTGKSAKVTAKKAGKTTITAKIGRKSVKCTITAKNPYLNVKKKTLAVKQAFQLKLTGAKIRSCKSDRPAVAKVSKSGKVTAKKAGKAVVSVTASNRKVYKCTVTVKGKNSQANSGSSQTDHENSQTDGGNSQTDTGGTQAKDLSGLGAAIHLPDRNYRYTGKAVEPDVKVSCGSLYLRNGADYTVSYSNNINAGKAKVTVAGIGGYKGKLTKEFEIEKANQEISAQPAADTIYVGKTEKINVSEAYGQLGFWVSNDKVAKVSNDGTLTGLSTGTTSIYMSAAGDGNHNGKDAYYVGWVSVMHEEATAYGFHIDVSSPYDSYKKSRINSRNEDGTNTYQCYFMCNADKKWLDQISFEAEDVTPRAYAKVFEDLGVAYGKPEITVEPADYFVKLSQKYGFDIHEPYTEHGAGNVSELPSSGKDITINAGAGVRVVKLSAKKDGVVLDYIYLGSNGEDANQEYSAYDLELYRRVRQQAEAQIWTDGMSNLEKLQALADYINETTHYPGYDLIKKEHNPTFWKDWAVDGKELLYDMCGDVVLNRIMDLQGGIIDCQAAGILKTAATEDLGLPYLYDAAADAVAPGEGVWKASGRYSSNPSNPYHESLVYKDSDETEVFLDAQGMTLDASSGAASCEAHGCREKLISLKPNTP